MINLALAAVTFGALHLLVSGTGVRDRLVARIGEGPYRGLFSVASIAALWWLIDAWLGVRNPQLTVLAGLRMVGAVLMLAAFALIVIGLTTPGPTSVGAEKQLEQDDNVHGVHRITRHPFLWGVALWAALHMVFNPQAANLVFFGCFLVVATWGTRSIDAKRARRFGARWAAYAARTSSLPFVAIVQGRNRLVSSEIGLWRVAAVLAAFGAFAWFHARLFGVPPF